MLKRRYIIVAVGIVSVLLASLLVNNVILAQSGGEYDPWLDYNEDGIVDANDLSPLGKAYGTSGNPTKNVNVTNFPLDEQGNIRTTIFQSQKIVLVLNATVSVPSNADTYNYLTSFNTSGFKYGYVMARAQGAWQSGANIHVWYFQNNFGIRTLGAQFSLNTASPSQRPDLGCGTSNKYEIHSTSTDLYLQVYNSDVGFDGLLTMAVYLGN